MQAKQPKKKKQKSHMGVGESFTFLAKSPYIRDLALLVRPGLSWLYSSEACQITKLWVCSCLCYVI